MRRILRLLLGRTIIVNESFDSAANIVLGTNLAVANGVLTATATASARTCAALPLVVPGASYRVTFTITAQSAGSLTPRVGGTSGTSRSAVATHTEVIVAGATTRPDLNFTSTADLSVDNWIIERI